MVKMITFKAAFKMLINCNLKLEIIQPRVI